MKNLGKVALSLAGGGSRGIIQVGYLKAWYELGLQYDILFGVSVGALNGVLVHQNDFDALEHLWLTIKTEDVYTVNTWELATKLLNAKSVYNSNPLENTIKKVLNFKKLVSNPKPFYINAADYTNWQDLQFESKEMPNEAAFIKFLRASASPPVLFPPVFMGGMMLCDGGTVNNFNIQSAVRQDCDTVVVMSPTNVVKSNPNPNLMEMIKLVTSVPPYAYMSRELGGINAINKIIDKVNETLEPDYKKINYKVIIPPEPVNIDLLDFNYKQDRKSLIKLGYDIAKEGLKDLV